MRCAPHFRAFCLRDPGGLRFISPYRTLFCLGKKLLFQRGKSDFFSLAPIPMGIFLPRKAAFGLIIKVKELRGKLAQKYHSHPYTYY